ncbi:MAG TPA: N-acetyl-alpha-D-glucosaminyl L-malate synthase BshA [Thermoanaerobaculaceae bacterium]|nr:N-acetyl-alpha-D-glucosaminyl L-malate synthase BshA [Thermoanaerobaculaceae bacterium]HPS79383.1 N-acetyl-alpha-D-glucosaminyl L-malate synthase BshA [Thermoanaerobaculaceae bacterium]
MKIGVTCYPTVGGSGTVATELGLAMARRGHDVHFICYALPYRLGRVPPGVTFHEVTVPAYPLFQYPPYSLALASQMADAVRTHGIELLHVHYAIPHAISAHLAREILGGGPRLVVTLHGTDITVVGADPSFLPIVRLGIERADAVTAVSADLARATHEILGVDRDIEVIHNFVDVTRCDQDLAAAHRRRLSPDGAPLLVHASNFRPVKRIRDVLEIFREVQAAVPCHLAMVGDGPERPGAERFARDAGIAHRVEFLGNVTPVEGVIAAGDVFLLPSQEESFGLAALEAMSCGVAVVASNAGGLPELVSHGDGGFVFAVGDTHGMAAQVIALLQDRAELLRQKELARRRAVEHFATDMIVDRYEALYRRLLA